MSRVAVAVVGAGPAGLHAANQLRRAGISGVVVVEQELSRTFDQGTDTWVLHTTEAPCHSRIVIAADQRTFVPWIPEAFRNTDFRGPTCHSSTWNPAFDPTGKRIAVVGGDAAGGRLIDHLSAGAAAVQVFGVPPRRFVPAPARRRTRRRRRTVHLETSLIDSVTATGIRTGDGVHHEFDVIVYATGLSVRDDPVRQVWLDGMEPYAGVAVHGCPNYFWLTGSDHDAQLRHIVDCLRLMDRSRATRIEVRRSSQQVFNERVHLRPRHDPVAHAYDLSSGADGAEHAYDGAATLTIDGTHRRVRVRLTGHLDPLDGKYHWQGTVFDPLPSDVLRRTRQVVLDAGERGVPARITEQTPQGAHSIAGVGAPPFALDGVELAAPRI